MHEIRHFHLFCGSGGGALGFNRAQARVGTARARFRCLGGVDADPAAVRDFSRLAGTPGTLLDLFDRDQYRDWHGCEPPAGWREAVPDDVRRAAGDERPHIVFTSPPCKGFSGLLSERRSTSAKYQALNRLTVRGLWLVLEAWADDPLEFVLLENVPRIATRGAPLLDTIEGLLKHHGYAVARTAHDCGELGGLAQSRKRFLLVARHVAKVPPFLYEPERHRLRAVGEVLERLPLPGDAAGGPMHAVPRLTWKTWVRLAFVEAGSDWRSLNRLVVEDGVLRDYLIVPEMHGGVCGVNRWTDSAPTISGRGGPTNGAYSVADPRRAEGSAEFGQYAVRIWDDVGPTVTGKAAPGAGPFSVADPRPGNWPGGKYRIVRCDEAAGAVIAASATGNGAFGVADPRCGDRRSGSLGVCPWDERSGTVTGEGFPTNGPFTVADPRLEGIRHNNVCRVAAWETSCPAVTAGGGPSSGGICVADPRPGIDRSDGHYITGGHYGVVPWSEPAKSVTGGARHDRGHFSVADPRTCANSQTEPNAWLPAAGDRLVCVIRALDGTWHRPFTTLELAALQGLVDPDRDLVLDGTSHTAWRERIGNMVPPPAARAIAGVMGTALLLARAGQTFALGATPIWVRPVAVAAAVDTGRTGAAE